MTALERYRGCQSHQAIVSFGEQVQYRPAKTVKTFKDEARWEPATWLGVNVETREHIVGTFKGVVKCRAIAAVEESKKFDSEKIQQLRGVPWQPVPHKKSNRIPTHIKEDEDDEEEDIEEEDEEKFEIQVEEAIEEDEDIPRKPQMVGPASGVRAMAIKKEDVEKYGYTKGCYECRAIREKWPSIQAHNH
eukprot:9464971-Karenia_brevis.AAC.1